MRQAGSSRAAAVAATERRVASCVPLLVSLAAAAVAADNRPPTSAPGAAPPAAPADPLAKQLAEGWRQLDLVNYAAAETAFRQVRSAGGTASQKAEATFGLGHLWQYRRPGADVREARKLYGQVASNHPRTRFGPLAVMALARLADTPEYEKDRRPEEARTLYRRLLDRYPTNLLAHEAALRLAMTYLEELDNPKAEDVGIDLLTKHLKAHPSNFLASVMHIQLGNVYQRRGRFRNAVRCWIEADAADARAAERQLTPRQRALTGEEKAKRVDPHRLVDRSNRAALYFRVAKVAEKRLQDWALAVRWYERIVVEIQRDNRYYASKLSARRCRKLAAEAGLSLPPPAYTDDEEEDRR